MNLLLGWFVRQVKDDRFVGWRVIERAGGGVDKGGGAISRLPIPFMHVPKYMVQRFHPVGDLGKQVHAAGTLAAAVAQIAVAC